MKNTIVELSDADFVEHFSGIFPFAYDELFVLKKGKIRQITSMESILLNHNTHLNYIHTDVLFEDVMDNTEGLMYLYNLFFSNFNSLGNVLFFTTFADTKSGSKGLIMPFSQLKHFWAKEHYDYYQWGLDVNCYDLFCYAYNEKRLFGIEHTSLPYTANM